MSPLQQVWTTCWSGLVLSGWDSLRVAWHLHSWVVKTVPSRGMAFTIRELKVLCHNVRGSALHSKRWKNVPCNIRKDVVDTFCRLAVRRPEDGFAFTRLSRSLPEPPVRECVRHLQAARLMASTEFPTSAAALGSLRSFVALTPGVSGNGVLRHPRRLPSSSSSCLEWPATRGGIDGYLEHLGHMCEEAGATQSSFHAYAGDSLGAFCLRKASVVLRPCAGVAADLRESYRCAGLLYLRSQGKPFGMKATALRAPGYKVRVVGVPDCLTFVEGSWTRSSLRWLAPGHWRIDGESRKVPGGMHYRAGRRFASLDLSKATDGLSHAAVRVVIEGLAARGLIRPADLTMSLRSLGLERGATWSFPDLGDEIGEGSFLRGSPMGTPLSFVVLSWVNAWATSAFGRAITHGDDAVGRYRPGSLELDLYASRVSSVGASLNREKTFKADHSWTACEIFALPREWNEDGISLFYPPSIPPPALRAPVEADQRLENLWLRRMERVMKSRFPWIVKDPRLHLPVQVGGLGYTGRGLAVGVSVRRRLGALVSRGPSAVIAADLIGKKPFREVGLYPRPLCRVVRPGSYWKAVRATEQWFQAGGDTHVPLESLLSFKSCLIEDEVRLLEGDKFKRKRVAGRPDRTRKGAVFRRLGVASCRPLTRRWGCSALIRWALLSRESRVTVPEDIASEIRERIPDPT